MKKVLVSFGLVAMFLASCNQAVKEEGSELLNTEVVNNEATVNNPEVDAENLPAFEFEEEVIDFGEVSQGEKVQRMFKFKNSGKSDLIISDAKGSCGCTVPVWPKNPIAPGEEAEIEVIFDSNGKQGRQHKTVTLVANTVPNTKVIAIKGDILTPDNTINNEQ